MCNGETLYCGCKTNLDARNYDSSSCGYAPANEIIRSGRLEAEHVLPASLIAKYRPGESCWVKDPSCRTARACCVNNDPQFRVAYTGLVNLHPTIGELNAARSNFAYAILAGEAREYGDCDFEVEQSNDLVEPREDVRGDVSRIYFHMEAKYDLSYPDPWNELLVEWDAEDPISDKEIARNERIRAAQGSSNEFVLIVEDQSD